MFNVQPSAVGNSRWFRTSGDTYDNNIRMNFPDNWIWRDGPDTRRNHVVFPLDRTGDVEFRATLHPPTSPNGELVYRIFGGTVLLYTSQPLTSGDSPINVSADVRPHSRLRIELDMRHTGGFNTVFHFDESFLGIENAVVVRIDS